MRTPLLRAVVLGALALLVLGLLLFRPAGEPAPRAERTPEPPGPGRLAAEDARHAEPRGETRRAPTTFADVIERRRARAGAEERKAPSAGEASTEDALPDPVEGSSGTPAVIVRLLDAEDGRPLLDETLRVVLREEERRSARIARTDGEGELTLAGLAPGVMALQLRHPRYLAHTRIVDVPPRAEQPARIEIALEPGRSITGVVVDEERAPVSRARVTLLGEGGARSRATTGEDGSFAVAGLPDGAWDVMVIGAAGGIAGPLPIEVPYPGRLRLVLRKGASLVAQTLTFDGRALEGAVVRARLIGLERSLAPGRAVSDARGEAVLEDLPPEADLVLEATHPGHPPVLVRVPGGAARPRSVEVVFPASLALRGRVVDRDGRPVANAAVGISGPEERTLRSTAGGDFLFRSLPEGTYRLRAATPDRGSSRGVEVELRAGERTERRLELERGPGRIAGRVVDRRGEPVALAPVRLETDDLVLARSADAGGRFRFEGLDHESYRLIAGDARIGTARLDAVSPDGGETIVRIDPPGTIRAFIDDPGPSGPLAVEVRESGAAPGDRGSRRTYRFSSNEPYFELEGLAPGSYRLRLLRRDGRSSDLGEVEVRAGETVGPVVLGR